MEQPDAAEFMKVVMARVGVATPSELARELGGRWLERDQGRKLYKWRNGESAPNFASTIELMRKAGMLNAEAAAKVAAAAPSRSPLEEIAARAAELARGQARIAAALGIELGSDVPVEAPEKPRQARPRRKRAAG